MNYPSGVYYFDEHGNRPTYPTVDSVLAEQMTNRWAVEPYGPSRPAPWTADGYRIACADVVAALERLGR